ncbi:MAG TPA: hypothetical protein VN726_06420 [Hanamia sp.]|nr:hypothetical protein [Hanamia sp.]
MLPKDFKEANFTFTKPQSMTDEQCDSLRVFKGKYPDGVPCIISKWQPNKEDIEAINNGEAIYLSIVGEGMPPVILFTENPFNK